MMLRKEADMRHVPWKELGWAVLVVVLLLGGYGGLYLASVKTDRDAWGIETWVDGQIHFKLNPCYRFGGEWSEAVFKPAHMVDRAIRPTYWVDLTPMRTAPPIQVSQ